MPIAHVVQQGEHLSQLAERYGFYDYRTIWDDAANAELKKLRVSPNVLMPGDVVQIPDKQQKSVARPTTKVHTFIVTSSPLLLRLALKDFGNEPLIGTTCVLTIDGSSTTLTTDGDGRIEMPITSAMTKATLSFEDPLVPFDIEIPIQIGHMDPVEETSGQKARLSNLGYITRPIDEVDDTFLEHVIQEFQCDFGLKVTGTCDGATQAKLKALHGS